MKKKILFTLILAISFSLPVYAELRILTNEEPPTNFMYEGELIGTTVAIVNQLITNMNLNAKIELLPWARAYKIAKENPNVVVFTCGRSQERIEHGFHFVGPVITRKHALFKKRGSPIKINSFEDLLTNKYRIGAMRGDWREKFFQDQGVQVDSVTEYRQNVIKLLKGRIDLMISSDIEMAPLLSKMNIESDATEIAFVFKEAPSYIMISRDTPTETVERWQKAFDQLKGTDFFKRTAMKYSNILGYQLEYSVNKGFFATSN